MSDWTYFDSQFEYEGLFDDAGSPWQGHKMFAYDLVRNTKPGQIVELGTHRGTSFFSFCQAAKDAGFDTEICAVDTWKGDEHAGFYGDEILNDVKEIVQKYYPSVKSKLLRKTFDEALADFDDESIDILHIDGLHTYEAVEHDYNSWLPKVKSGGIIMLHDIFIKRGNFKVYSFWNEVKKEHCYAEFYHSYGLGILFIGRNNPWKEFESYWQMHYSEMSENAKNRRLRRINTELISLNIRLRRINNELISLKQVVYNKEKEIGFMQSSKYWKIREWVEKMKENIRR